MKYKLTVVIIRLYDIDGTWYDLFLVYRTLLHLFCTRLYYSIPPIKYRYQSHLVTQHHLQVPVPTSPCLFVREERVIVAYQVTGTGTLSHSLILTLSLWLTWFKFKSIEYGTHAFLQKYQCNIHTALVPGIRYPNDGHDLNSNHQMSTYVYLQKYLYNISVSAVQQQ